MLIREDGSIVGTIGGGMVERKVIDEALEALSERESRMFHGRMARTGSDAVGSDCGGAMSVYISVHGLRPRLLLVGAGHVNRAVAHAAALVDFDICVGDIYPASLCPEAFPLSARLVHGSSFTEVVEAMAVRPQDFVLIATNNQDREALDRLITQPVAWLGLLASRRKVQAFYARCGRTACRRRISAACGRRLVMTSAPRRQTRLLSAYWRKSCR